MFNSSTLKAIRISFLLSQASLQMNWNPGSIYVYDELTHDTVNLLNQRFMEREEESLENKTIRIGVSNPLGLYGFFLWSNLAIIYNFDVDVIHFETMQEAYNNLLVEEIDGVLQGIVYGDMYSLPPILTSGAHLYIKHPQKNVISSYFINVFDSKVWYCVLMIVGIIIFIIVVCKLFKIGGGICDGIELVFDVIGIAARNTEIGGGLRFMQLVFGFFMVIIMSAFSTFLLSELAIFDFKLPFHNLDEVYQQDLYRICIARQSYVYSREMNKSDRITKLINTGNCPVYKFNNQDYAKSVCTHENTVYLSYLQTIHNFGVRGLDCEIYKFNTNYYPISKTLPLRNEFNTNEQLHWGIIKLRTSAILKKIYIEAIEAEQIYVFISQAVDNIIVVEIQHVILIIFGLAASLLLSVILLAFEILLYSYISH